jgi:[ribosomal protein S18]-alanine N-acetyltransferase
MPAVEPLRDAEEAEQCAQFMAASEPWLTLGVPVATAVGVVTDARKEVYAARDERGVSGFIVIDMRGLVAGYIQTLCVRPDRRGQGIGTELVRFAETRVFRDSPNVFICVSSFNPGARRLYERLGYEVVGTLREFVLPGHDELLLRKTCGSWSQFRKGDA